MEVQVQIWATCSAGASDKDSTSWHGRTRAHTVCWGAERMAGWYPTSLWRSHPSGLRTSHSALLLNFRSISRCCLPGRQSINYRGHTSTHSLKKAGMCRITSLSQVSQCVGGRVSTTAALVDPLLSDTSLCGTMHFDFFLFIFLICKMGVILSYLATLFYFRLWKRSGSRWAWKPWNWVPYGFRFNICVLNMALCKVTYIHLYRIILKRQR